VEIIESKKMRQLVLFTVALSTFMATIDGSIVNIALPVIGKAFGVGMGMTSWTVSAYLLTISALLLIWGRLSDLIGQKKLFLGGLILFALGSLSCALSGSLIALVMSRVLQGVGASITMALVQGIVTAIFPMEERGKALGMIGTVVALGSLVGPGLGSLFIQYLNWQAIFYINLPIGLVAFFLAYKLLPDQKNRKIGTDFDGVGASLLMLWVLVTFISLMLYAERLISLGWMGLGGVASVIIGYGLLAFEKKQSSPLLPLVLFRNSVFVKGVLTSYLSYVTMFAYIILMPFYLQRVHGIPIVMAGLLMSVYPMVTAVVSPFSGWLSDKFTSRPLTIMGMGLTVFAYWQLSSLQADTSLGLIAFAIGFLGFSTGLFQSPNTSSVMGSVQRQQMGIAGSASAFFRNFGMVTGVSLGMLLFTVFAQKDLTEVQSGLFDPEVFMSGFRGVLLVSSGMCFGGFLVLLRKTKPQN
jgi:EmrB/QacA subfamily drug resistance transporter